jgi:hypothetical protein
MFSFNKLIVKKFNRVMMKLMMNQKSMHQVKVQKIMMNLQINLKVKVTMMKKIANKLFKIFSIKLIVNLYKIQIYDYYIKYYNINNI